MKKTYLSIIVASGLLLGPPAYSTSLDTHVEQQENAIVTAGKEGFQLKSGDGKFILKLRGLLQADGRFFVDQAQAQGVTSFVPRSIRPTFEGTLWEKFGFRITPDFGNGAATLQDAYADIHIHPGFKIRAGKFKEPVGLERLQSEDTTLFAERALPTNLVPNRDVGVQLYGDIAGGVLSYAVGGFNGVADGASGDTDTNDGKDIAGRLFVQPFFKTGIAPLKGLGVGVAGSYGKQKGTAAAPNLPGYRTGGQQTFFRYINDTATPNVTVASGKVLRIAPQAYYSWGPFGLLGEYVRSTQNVSNNSGTANLTHQAWQAAASYALTGEKASYKGVKPANPFSLKERHWGAVELVARYNELRVDATAFPNFASLAASAQRTRGFGGGVNWYVNDNIRLVADYEHTVFSGGAAAGNRPPEHVIESRLQLVF